MNKHYGTLYSEVKLPFKFSVGPVFFKFFEALKEKKIIGNTCPKCGKTLVPPRSFCPVCYVEMGEFQEIPQQGELVSWTIVNKSIPGAPVDPPFIIGLIKLDETDCNFLHLIGGVDQFEFQKLRSGMRVQARWKEERKGHLLDIACFEPI